MKNKIFYILVIGIIIFLIFFVFNKKNTSTTTTIPNVNITDQNESISMGELIIEDIKVGEGEEATSGKEVTVNYVGTLINNTKFDSSYDRNEPFVFNLGAGEVIKGWDLGVKGMKVGGKRKLTIPADFGYGASGAGSLIPPNSTLIFEIELLKVE